MLDDEDIEKRIEEELTNRTRQTMAELVTRTGIEQSRLFKVLRMMEDRERCAHITLEGTPRFYITAANLKNEKKAKKIDANCPWCGEGGFVNHWALGAHKRYCEKKPVLGKSIYPPKEIKPPLVLDSPSVTTTGDVTTAWNISQSVPIVPSGGKEVENKEAETMEELGKVGQYNRVRCPRCGTVWRLIKVLTYKSPTAILVECPFCRT